MSTIMVKVAREEHKWKARFGATMLNFKIADIAPADFWIGTDTQPQFIMIERKTFDDFHHSLVQKRLEEQRKRMVEERTAGKTVYLGFILEGQVRDRRNSYRKLDGAIENLLFKHGAFVLYSADLDHTRSIIEDIVKKVPQYMDGITTNPSVATLPVGLKKKSIGVDEYLVYAISIIPQVSHSTAQKFVQMYPSMMSVRDAINLAAEQGVDFESVVAAIPLSGTRKFGPALAKRLVSYLSKLL